MCTSAVCLLCSSLQRGYCLLCLGKMVVVVVVVVVVVAVVVVAAAGEGGSGGGSLKKKGKCICSSSRSWQITVFGVWSVSIAFTFSRSQHKRVGRAVSSSPPYLPQPVLIIVWYPFFMRLDRSQFCTGRKINPTSAGDRTRFTVLVDRFTNHTATATP